MAKGNAKEIVTLWQTRMDNLMSGEIPTDRLEELVKAARVGGKDAIKLLGFKNTSRGGKKIINILAEPCDPYTPQGAGRNGSSQQQRGSW